MTSIGCSIMIRNNPFLSRGTSFCFYFAKFFGLLLPGVLTRYSNWHELFNYHTAYVMIYLDRFAADKVLGSLHKFA